MLGIGTITKKVFGTPNDRLIKKTRPLVEQINALEPEFEKLSDDGLKDKTEAFAKRAMEGEDLDDLLPEAFANCREAARRTLGIRAFDTRRCSRFARSPLTILAFQTLKIPPCCSASH